MTTLDHHHLDSMEPEATLGIYPDASALAHDAEALAWAAINELCARGVEYVSAVSALRSALAEVMA